MADAVKTPNVVEATNKPGLFDKLEELQKRWVWLILMKHCAETPTVCSEARGEVCFPQQPKCHLI